MKEKLENEEIQLNQSNTEVVQKQEGEQNIQTDILEPVNIEQNPQQIQGVDLEQLRISEENRIKLEAKREEIRVMLSSHTLSGVKLSRMRRNMEKMREAKENKEPIDEGLFGAIFGGLSGAIAGPAIGKAICKAMSIDERGMLGNLFTSRLFLTALGGYIGWKK